MSCNYHNFLQKNDLQRYTAIMSEKETNRFNMHVHANTFWRNKFLLKGTLGRCDAHLHGKRAILTGQKISLQRPVQLMD